MQQSNHDWIAVLPLIHALSLPAFTSGKTYNLSSAKTKHLAEDSIKGQLFCGLKVENFEPNTSKYVSFSNIFK